MISENEWHTLSSYSKLALEVAQDMSKVDMEQLQKYDTNVAQKISLLQTKDVKQYIIIFYFILFSTVSIYIKTTKNNKEASLVRGSTGENQ